MINLQKILGKDDLHHSQLILPLLPLRDIVVFPYMVAPLFVGRTKSVNALANSMNNKKSVFLSIQKTAGIDNPKEKDISTIGTIGTVLQLLRLPDGTVKALVEGKTRGRIVNFIRNEDFFQVGVEPLQESEISDAESVALSRRVVESFKEYAIQMQKNAKVMAKAFIDKGYHVVSGGTDNHSMLIDLRTKFPDITGKKVENTLVKAEITINKNMVPFDTRSPFSTSGLRVGTPAITTRGLKEQHMEPIVNMIDKVIIKSRGE